MFYTAIQPMSISNLEQFWNVESVGITLKDESTNNFLNFYVTNSVERLNDGSYYAFSMKEQSSSSPQIFFQSSVPIVLEH